MLNYGLGIGFLLLISMVITTLLEIFTKAIGHWLTLPPFIIGCSSVIAPGLPGATSASPSA